jgi:hypothetical protein
MTAVTFRTVTNAGGHLVRWASTKAQRPRLFGVAYWMLGEATEAEDVVQDAYLRRRSVDGVTRPAAWLTPAVEPVHQPADVGKGTARSVRRPVAAGTRCHGQRRRQDDRARQPIFNRTGVAAYLAGLASKHRAPGPRLSLWPWSTAIPRSWFTSPVS